MTNTLTAAEYDAWKRMHVVVGVPNLDALSELNRLTALRLLGKLAADREVDFTWRDAAVLSQKIRQSVEVG